MAEPIKGPKVEEYPVQQAQPGIGAYPQPPPGQYPPAPGYPAPPPGGYPPEQYPGPPAPLYTSNGQPTYPPPMTVAPPAIVINYQNGCVPPSQVTCANCKATVCPRRDYEMGSFAWLLAGGLCVFGCCCVAWVPCVADGAKDQIFKCPACNHELSRVRRM